MLRVTVAPTPKTTDLRQVLPAGQVAFLAMGAAAALYGPALRQLAAESGRPTAQTGLVFVVHWTGFFLSTLVTNALARRVEMQRAVLAGLGLMLAGTLGLIGLPAPLNLLVTVMIGLGAGMLEILLNRSAEFLAGRAPAAALARLHAPYGLGAVVMPLLVEAALGLGLGWRWAPGVVAAVLALAMGLALRWAALPVPHGQAGTHWGHLPWGPLLPFVLILVIYVGAEVAVGGWVTTYFAERGLGESLGRWVTAAFFLCFALGRVVFATVAERAGYRRTVQATSGLAAAALLLPVASPALAPLGFALAGLAFSLIFPTMLAWGARRFPEHRAPVASLSIAATGAGAAVVPFGVGLVVQAAGPGALPPLLVGLTLAVAGLAYIARQR